jgi:hypothetical protein
MTHLLMGPAQTIESDPLLEAVTDGAPEIERSLILREGTVELTFPSELLGTAESGDRVGSRPVGRRGLAWRVDPDRVVSMVFSRQNLQAVLSPNLRDREDRLGAAIPVGAVDLD